MDSRPNVVAIICARGGSKGLVHKNIRPLMGKPLIAYTIMAAQQAQLVDRIIVSTDDEEIAIVAREHGAETPFLRPAEFATDSSPVEPALTHAIDWLKDNDGYETDIVVYLQVTDIFRQRHFIDQTVMALIEEDSLETCFIGYPTHKKFWRKDGDKFVRVTHRQYNTRQTEKQFFYREDTGLACSTRASVIRKGFRVGDTVRIISNEDDASSLDIHDESDLRNAEALLRMHKENDTQKYYY